MLIREPYSTLAGIDGIMRENGNFALQLPDLAERHSRIGPAVMQWDPRFQRGSETLLAS